MSPQAAPIPVAQPDRPSQVMIMKTEKNVGVALLLTFLFGPIGMFYSTILGGIVMLIISIPAALLTLGLSLLITQPICLIWAALAASSYNRKLHRGG